MRTGPPLTQMIRLFASVAFAMLALVQFTGAQDPAPPAGGRGRGAGPGQAGPPRPNFPQQQRVLADSAVIARGKALYETNCAACHGMDLRGGQLGGPNLLRSQTVLSDQHGELIAPIVQSGRPNPTPGAAPMPPFSLPQEDIKAVAEYLHSVLAQAGAQGRPPAGEMVPPEKVLVGDAAAGQAYFSAKCASCHSVTGDLKGIGSRVGDPRELQDRWVSGGRGGRGGRGRGASEEAQARPVTVAVTPASGPRVEGRLLRMDDFVVTLIQEDGTRRTFVRKGDVPKVEVQDPSNAHRTLVPTLAEKDMHNVTAYLWTIK